MLDTLAQKASTNNIHDISNPVYLLHGTGSSKESMRKRPKRKFITQKLCLSLIDVAKDKGDSIWEKRYWNTYHCQNLLRTNEGRAYGHYCKNRWCSICVSIRKADLINKYKPIIDKWSDVHFLTLTVKAQPHSNLIKWMGGMIEAFKKIRRKGDQNYKRGRGTKLIGIRSLECNFNPIKKTYNPHFHILTADKRIALSIKKEWTRIWTSKYALPYLQKIRKVNSTEEDLIEIIKYGAKIFTDPTMTKPKKKLNMSFMLPPHIKSLSPWKDIAYLVHLALNCPRVMASKIILNQLQMLRIGYTN